LAAVLYDKDSTGQDDFLGRYRGTCMRHMQQWPTIQLGTLSYPIHLSFLLSELKHHKTLS